MVTAKAALLQAADKNNSTNPAETPSDDKQESGERKLRICRNCGAESYNKLDFCLNCGARYDGSEPYEEYVERREKTSDAKKADISLIISAVVFSILVIVVIIGIIIIKNLIA